MAATARLLSVFGVAAATLASANAGILPTGLGASIDRSIERARAATERFKDAQEAVGAGYRHTNHCVENPPHGGMGLHFINQELLDTTLEVEKPEVLVYEQRPDGSYKLNGVEYLVPISAWTSESPPRIMGQALKRSDRLGLWYLHVWIWEPSPSGVFADWNPRVKCLNVTRM